MDLITLLPDVIVKQLIDIIVKYVKEKVLAEVDPHIKRINTEIGIMRDNQEKMRLFYLHAGLNSFRRGDLSEAIKHLDQVEQVVDIGAVACFWSSVIHEISKEPQIAIDKMREALGRNPFVIPPRYIPGQTLPTVTNQISLQIPQQTWIREAYTYQDLYEKIPQRSLREKVGDMLVGVVAGDIAVVRISNSGNNPTIEWKRGSHHAVSALDLSTGACLWTKMLENQKLLFATPHFVVLESLNDPKRFDILDARDGNTKQVASQPYFEEMFFPGYSQIPNIPGYQKSNQSVAEGVTEVSAPFGERVFVINVITDIQSFDGGLETERNMVTTEIRRMQ